RAEVAVPQPDVRQPRVPRRALEQSDPELVLEFGNSAADGLDWHAQRLAASEKLFASTTLAKITSEFRSAIAFPVMERYFADSPANRVCRETLQCPVYPSPNSKASSGAKDGEMGQVQSTTVAWK